MSENKFWMGIWSLAAVVVVAIVVAVSYAAHDRRDKWEKVVSNGADPMVAACAIFIQERMEEAACLLMSQNRK
jgi:hypothetical protein